MGLVDYGSSDESETEESGKKQTLFAPLPAPKTKQRSNHVRIKVEGPRSSSDEALEEEKTRLVKKVKGSGLSALLPPPKRSNMREPVQSSVNGTKGESHGNGTSLMTVSDDESVTMTGSNVAFRPTSMRRPIVSSSQKGKEKKEAQEIRHSLFPISTTFPDRRVQHEYGPRDDSSAYRPLLATESRPMIESPSPPPPPTTESTGPVESIYAHPSDQYRVDSGTPYLASSNDDDVETQTTTTRGSKRRRREEMEQYRDGPAAEMQEYNVETQYAQNLAFIESGAGIEAAPVRFVGSGKHQLSSLLNLAQSQQESMETSFANQKRAMRDGKAKYGR